MYPKTHIIFGAIFSIFLIFLLDVTFLEASLVFFSSFLIDVDHYLFYVVRKKDWSLRNAYIWWSKKLPKYHKPVLNLLHTIEFLTLIFIISFYSEFFLFIFIGLIFHSILDIIDIVGKGLLNAREFSFIRYLIRDKRKYF